MEYNRFELNDLFEYGITDDCVQLHLPVDLHILFKRNGKIKATSIIGLKLIEAIEEVNMLRNNGNEELEKCKSISMISPMFYAPTFYPEFFRNKGISKESPALKILEFLNIDTKTITSSQLKNKKFIENNNEAIKIIRHFGDKRDVGIASIDFKRLNHKDSRSRFSVAKKILTTIIKEEKVHEKEKE